MEIVSFLTITPQANKTELENLSNEYYSIVLELLHYMFVQSKSNYKKDKGSLLSRLFLMRSWLGLLRETSEFA